MAIQKILLILISGTFAVALPKCGPDQRPFVADESDCKEYYVCINGQLHRKSCSNQLLFDNDSGRCDWKELVPNCYSSISSFCEKPDGLFVKRGSYCRKYFDCRNGVAIEMSCPTERLFDEETGICDWKEVVKCKHRDSFCPESDGTFLVEGTKCKSYVICKKGKAASVRQCSEGQLFNSEGKYCDWHELVDCSDKDVTVTEQVQKTTLFQSSTGFGDITESISQQPATLSSGKITKITPTSTTFNAEKISTSSHLLSTTVGEQVITSTIDEPKTSTNSPMTFSTRSGKMTTPVKVPQTSTDSPLVWSTTSKPVTTPISVAKTTSNPQLMSSTKSKSITTSVSIDGTSSTSHIISSTVTNQVTTAIEIPKTSSYRPSILSTTSNRVSTVTTTAGTSNSSPAITKSDRISTSSIAPTEASTAPQKITTVYDTTSKDIITSSASTRDLLIFETSSQNLTPLLKTDSTILKPITNSVVRTTSKITIEQQPSTSSTSNYETTPRGCTFGDPGCQPDETLCPGEFGEFPHPDTPLFFVHCDHWRPYIKRCPHDLHFDPELKVCDWPK